MTQKIARTLFCGCMMWGATLGGCDEEASLETMSVTAEVGQPLEVDLLALEDRGGAAFDGCDFLSEGLPDGAVVEGAWLLWTPMAGQEGEWQLLLEPGVGCSRQAVAGVLVIDVGQGRKVGDEIGKDAPPESGATEQAPTTTEQVHDFEGSQSGS